MTYGAIALVLICFIAIAIYSKSWICASCVVVLSSVIVAGIYFSKDKKVIKKIVEILGFTFNENKI
jgi:hypothetical protein